MDGMIIPPPDQAPDGYQNKHNSDGCKSITESCFAHFWRIFWTDRVRPFLANTFCCCCARTTVNNRNVTQRETNRLLTPIPVVNKPNRRNKRGLKLKLDVVTQPERGHHFDSLDSNDPNYDQNLAELIHGKLKSWTNEVLADQNTLEVTGKRATTFRYPHQIGVPSDTAVTLPATEGESDKRLHGNYVQIYDKGPAMIATQSPLPQAQGDFWLAAYKNTNVIVDLTQQAELLWPPGGLKAHVYYPEDKNESKTFASGGINLTVSLKQTKQHAENEDINISTYLVTDNDGNEKTINRVHFRNWRDHKGIEPNVMHQLLDQVDSIADKDKKVIVHCSAGVGRTGTFITARTAKHLLQGQKLSDQEIYNHIIEMAKKGREQRGKGFIQKPAQVETLLHYFRSLRGSG